MGNPQSPISNPQSTIPNQQSPINNQQSAMAFGLSSAMVKEEAIAAGFDLCGIAPATDLAELGFLQEWLSRGYAGEMHYMHRTADRRRDVREVLPSAESVILLGVVYNTNQPYSTGNTD